MEIKSSLKIVLKLELGYLEGEKTVDLVFSVLTSYEMKKKKLMMMNEEVVEMVVVETFSV